jgi:hypothetical protein
MLKPPLLSLAMACSTMLTHCTLRQSPQERAISNRMQSVAACFNELGVALGQMRPNERNGEIAMVYSRNGYGVSLAYYSNAIVGESVGAYNAVRIASVIPGAGDRVIQDAVRSCNKRAAQSYPLSPDDPA